MSHSSFKLIANDEPMSQNLIIVVNKNGSVGTDTATLQNLLTSKDTPKTGVTILRQTSPTPSISDEIEDERMEEIAMLRKEYLDKHPNADEDEIEEHLKTVNSIPHVTLSVENYFAPDQARKFANDVLHLGGIDNPQTLMPIDFNFRRKIVQNDHCYTPLTMSPERIEKSSAVKKKDLKSSKKEALNKAKVKQSTSMIVEEENSADSAEGSDLEEEQSTEEEISYSESDDDNDMDFSVNDRFGKKGTKKKRKYRRQKQRNLTFKDFLLEGGGAADLSSLDDEPKKKYGKVGGKKASLTSSSSSSSRPSTSASKNTNVSTKSSQQTSAKKLQAEKAKVAQGSQQQTKFTPSSTFKAATTSAASQISQISIQSAAPTKSTIQEREIVESIAKDLEKSFPESNTTAAATIVSPLKKAENIPNIMQIMEPNTSAEVLDQSLSTLEHIDSGDGTASIEEIGDALIAVLGNEAIDELLNQNVLMNFEQNNSAIVKPSNSTQMQQVPLLADTITPSSPTTPTIPKILNKQAPQKDPIKIVKNGRVITLPVIEAPATRGAKRRAQGDPITPVATPPNNKTIKTEKTPSNKDPDSRNSSRRSSLNKSESRRQSIATQGGGEDDANSDASWNSEDDPDRLWCICKQPHNNRFMICCDKCEDWFHGTCVNVTKSQGKIMEQSNKKWLCPNCKTSGSAPSTVKKDPSKKALNQQKLTKFFSKHQKESTDEDVPNRAANVCVVCSKNPTRPDSIYCSDECIQNHATKHTSDQHTQPHHTPQPQKTEVKRGNILKNQEGNVIVYDKTSDKLLSSKLWPHISVLQQWLAQNPSCEPVRPGTNKAEILMSNISNKKQLSSALQTPTISSTTPPVAKNQPVDDLFSNPVKIHTGNAPSTPNTPTINTPSNNKKLNRSQSLKSPTTPNSPSSQSSNNSSSKKSNNSTPLPTKKVDDKKLKRQVSDEKLPTPTSTKAKVELERQSVRNNFKSTLASRMKDFEHPTIAKMTDEEIEKFAKHLELEMFLYFNKDTKDKYKNKFRSLKFNLSDVKNKTLIEKICTRKLTPKQLVTLSASDLASEELAKWREDENKHQLEIITKSELDAISQNKIVVKTHKGEEIIETNPAPTEILIPGAEDDIETAISSKTHLDDSHGRHDKSPLSSPSISSSTGRAKRSRSRSKSRGHDHHSHHSHSHHKSSSSSSSKHKRRSRSKSRSRSDHHSSRSSHGSSSRDKSRNRSKHREEKHHHRDKSKSNDTDSKSSSSKSKDSKSTHHSHSHHHHHHHSNSSSTHREKEKDAQPKEKKPREIEPQQEDVDLVGKILDSMGVHLDIKKDTPIEEKSEDVTSTDPIAPVEKVVEPVNEHRLEIEIYSGSMYMAEVAKFDVTASVVSGNVDDVMKKFSPTMEIVGRIEPKIVWDYLAKVKRVPGKELVVLRFSSTNESAYFSLFSYLHTRQRYGVIKASCPMIKDFYLMTVEANRPLPPVLLPIDGPGFIEGEEHKPDLLIGVFLKIVSDSKHMKRSTKETVKKSTKPAKPPVEHNVPIELLPTRHKSHHHHHGKLVMGLPEINDDLKESSPTPSDDEPYEPMDEDEDIHRAISSTSISSKLNNSDDLESQMEQINRQIELRQMEIQKMAQQKAMELDEASASRIFEKISVPHNLSEILSTIKASSEPKPMEIDDDEDDDLEYVPMPTNSTQSNAEYRASTSYPVINPPIVNSMMDIDERINLFRAQEMSVAPPPQQSASRLASMSDADLMKLVPDNELAAPPPPIISNPEPAIPGLEYSSNVDN